MEAGRETRAGGCPNCGSPIRGTWCDACGRRNAHARLSVRAVVAGLPDDLPSGASAAESGTRAPTPRKHTSALAAPPFALRVMSEGGAGGAGP